MKRQILRSYALLLFGWFSPVWAQAPIGEPFQINEEELGNQFNPSVCKDGEGNFVVAWTRVEQDQNGYSGTIVGKMFNSTGVKRTSDFTISAPVEDEFSQSGVQVACAADGRFVAAWIRRPFNLDFAVLDAQLYDATGNKRGSPFRISDRVHLYATSFALVSDVAGNFMAAWTESNKLRVRFFDSNGNPKGAGASLGQHFQPSLPEARIADNGQSIVVWQEFKDGHFGETSLFGQRFDAAGQLLGNRLQIQFTKDSNMITQDVAFTEGNRFVVAWTEAYYRVCGSTTQYGAFAQQFDSDSAPLDRVKFTDDSQRVTVRGAGQGQFLVVWNQTDKDPELAGRVYDARAQLVGSEFAVSEAEEAYNYGFQVSDSRRGEAIVVWSDFQDRTRSHEILGQRIRVSSAEPPPPATPAPTATEEEDEEGGGCGRTGPLPPSGGLGSWLLVLAVTFGLFGTRRRNLRGNDAFRAPSA